MVIKKRKYSINREASALTAIIDILLRKGKNSVAAPVFLTLQAL